MHQKQCQHTTYREAECNACAAVYDSGGVECSPRSWETVSSDPCLSVSGITGIEGGLQEHEQIGVHATIAD